MLGMRPKHAAGSLVVLVLLAVVWLLSNHASALPSRPTPAAAPVYAGVRGGGRNVAVPQSCTPEVNEKLAGLLARQTQDSVDNVMVCGTTVSPSRTHRGGEQGSHEILPLLVNLPGVGFKLVEVVTNDELDGVVTAPKGAQVYAYGQAFFPERSQFVAGIHDVHCATHKTADNGWVVVNGTKSPTSCTKYQHR
jgi:hypothetical protein